MLNLEEIIHGCIKGQRAAQSQLFKQFGPVLLGICFRYANSRDDAEEILQEAFIKIFSKIDSYRNEGSFEGWMKRITVNTAINHLRKNKKVSFVDEMTERHGALPDDDGDMDDFRDLIESETLFNCIADLPDGYRIVLNLFAIEGLSHRDIAERLNISESTSRSQFTRAKQLLKKKLEPYIKKKVGVYE